MYHEQFPNSHLFVLSIFLKPGIIWVRICSVVFVRRFTQTIRKNCWCGSYSVHEQLLSTSYPRHPLLHEWQTDEPPMLLKAISQWPHTSTGWEMKNPVLLTRPVYEQHTSIHLAEKLQEAVAKFKLKKPRTIAVTTDSTGNIVDAVSESTNRMICPQIGWFALTFN